MHLFKNASVHELTEFVERSTMADKKEDVARFLLYFLFHYEVTEEIKQFIKGILHDEHTLEKVVIVNEHELYETVFMLSNQHMEEPSCFKTYQEQAETIFLCVRVQGKEEDEIIGWKDHYEQEQSSIIDFILDEYLLLKKWEEFTNNISITEKLKGWEQVLALVLAEEKDR